MHHLRPTLAARAAIVVACLATIVIATGCGSSKTSRASGPGTPSSNAGKPTALDVAETTPPQTLDPQTSDQIADNAELALSYQCLMQTTASGQLKPALATGFRVADHGLSYTFNLRHNVHFDNGQLMTSADVVYSYHRLFKSGSPTLTALYTNFSDNVTAAGPYKVVFKLTAPNAGFPQLLGSPVVDACAILSKSAGVSQLATRMIGTGPWEQVSYTPNVSLAMKRYAGYWGPKTASPTLKMLFIPQASTQLADFNAGTVNIIFPPKSDVQTLKASSQNVVAAAPTANIAVLEFNTAAPPFNNVDVRRAVALAINRSALVQIAYTGAAVPTSYVPPGYSWATPLSSLPYSSYDPNKAKQLLASAGFGHGVKVTLQYITGYDPGTNEMMAQVQSELAAVGIHATLVPEQTATWIARSETSYKQFTLGWNEVPYQADPEVYTQVFSFEHGPGKGQPPAQLQSLTNRALNASGTSAFDADVNAIEKYEDNIVYPRLELVAINSYVAYRSGMTNVSVPPSGSTAFLANVK